MTTTEQTNTPAIEIPEDYHGIPFRAWLDIFLEYALCLARNGDAREAYRAAHEVLSREDHYILIMINDALGGKVRKKLFGII